MFLQTSEINALVFEAQLETYTFRTNFYIHVPYQENSKSGKKELQIAKKMLNKYYREKLGATVRISKEPEERVGYSDETTPCIKSSRGIMEFRLPKGHFTDPWKVTS